MDVPDYRPVERFWPYVDLPEQPTDEELARLDPGARRGAVRHAAAAVLGLAGVPAVRRPGLRAGAGHGARRRPSSSRFGAGAAAALPRPVLSAGRAQLRNLFDIVGRFDATDVLIDDRPVPYARELWLPLLWFLIR